MTFLGYEQFKLWRSDKSLCFGELVGEQLVTQTPTRALGGASSSKKKKGSKTPGKGSYVDMESEGEEDIELEEELNNNDVGEDSDEGVVSTPSSRIVTTIRK